MFSYFQIEQFLKYLIYPRCEFGFMGLKKSRIRELEA